MGRVFHDWRTVNEQTLAELLTFAREADQDWLHSLPEGRASKGAICDIAWKRYAEAYQKMHPYVCEEY